MSPAGDGAWSENIIYTLNQETGIGASSELGGVVFDASGNMYGVSASGVFELTPSSTGWTETTISPFSNSPGPNNPYSGVTLEHNSILWGTTAWGGGGTCSITGNGCGTLYRVQKVAGVWQQNALLNFRDQSKGWFPTAAPIIDSAGNVYGTTLNGGAYGNGVVYEVTP